MGTPYGFTPYRGSDVKGYVKIRGIWMTASAPIPADDPNLPGEILVSRLGWGNTFAGFLTDFTPDEQALLRTTVTVEERIA
jgi:hypothetical protein